MQKQVSKSHYSFTKYMKKNRWVSIWHQLDEVIRYDPDRVLEIGPGPGLFKAAATAFGLKVETLDLDPELNPDHTCSVLSMPFSDGEFDVVCAFQMLEHLPFEKSVKAFAEMARVAKKAVIISLPNAATRWPYSIYIPKLGTIAFSIPRPRLRAIEHRFDGEHYWELNKVQYGLQKVEAALCNSAPVVLKRSYRVTEIPYHHFFVFSKKLESEHHCEKNGSGI